MNDRTNQEQSHPGSHMLGYEGGGGGAQNTWTIDLNQTTDNVWSQIKSSQVKSNLFSNNIISTTITTNNRV